MNERTRLIIHTGGVLAILWVIVLMRWLFYYFYNPLDFIKGELVFYIIGMIAILIFTQFLISTTFNTEYSNNSKNQSLKKENRSQNDVDRLKNKLKELQDRNSDLEKKIISDSNAYKKLKNHFYDSIKSPNSLIKPVLADVNPLIHITESYFFNTLDILNDLKQKGFENYELEGSTAFLCSIQIYKMFQYVVENTDNYTPNDIEGLLKKYATILNKSLEFVEVVNYGYKNTFDASSHDAYIGFVNEYDEIYPISFKVTSKKTGRVIHKALVQKV